MSQPSQPPQPSRVPRSLRWSAAAAMTMSLAGLSLVAAAPAASAASTVSYVALGDSYASGLGAGNYSDGSCDQSANAYPVLWHNGHGGSFTNATCSGATTSDVLNSQLSGLSTSTTLVTMTIGGNDVGFSNVLITCVLESTNACVSAVKNAENQANTTLPGSLNNLLSAIKSRAPNATVILLGYPEFYDLAKSSTCIGLSTTDRTYLNPGSDVLDSQVKAAADRYGDTYVNVNPDFAGHQICDSDSYLISVDWLNLGDSYHPNASGQKDGYLPAVNSVTH